MGRRFLIVALATMAFIGFGSGFAHVFHGHRHGHGRWADRRDAFEARLADRCVEAADRRLRGEAAPANGEE